MRNDTPSANAEILVASADNPFAMTLAQYLEVDGHLVQRCHDAKGVLRLVGRKPFQVVVLDLELDKEGDLGLVSFVRRQRPRTQLILLFDIAQVERAIEGIRQGAYFYLPKESAPSDVALVVNKALRSIRTNAAIDQYEQSLREEMVGSTGPMKRVFELVRKVAPTDSTVLLRGESGTGKELLANTIHRLSARRDMAFIAINCAALPEQLLESEMFGHVRGAFTGAQADKTGLFEEADGGTLFLDEIGDTALVTQAKLLRVLQNGEIRRVGASTTSRVDVRVIAATNRDLEEAITEKTFREDLYFRLNVIQIRVPPLRERMDALPTLANHFLARANAHFRKAVRGFDEYAQVLLRGYDYPGNVRELETIVSHAVIMCDADLIRPEDLPDQVRSVRGRRMALPHYASDSIPTLEEMERRLIQSALERLGGNQTEVAKRLGISRSTLWRKMKEYRMSSN